MGDDATNTLDTMVAAVLYLLLLLIPFVVLIDGAISCWRTYTPWKNSNRWRSASITNGGTAQ